MPLFGAAGGIGRIFGGVILIGLEGRTDVPLSLCPSFTYMKLSPRSTVFDSSDITSTFFKMNWDYIVPQISNAPRWNCTLTYQEHVLIRN
jgi:hypothetical protein